MVSDPPQTVAPGLVILTYPAGGADGEGESKVSLFISSGPSSTTVVVVSNVVGDSITELSQLFSQSGRALCYGRAAHPGWNRLPEAPTATTGSLDYMPEPLVDPSQKARNSWPLWDLW